jgi:hypothetical protein
MLNLDYNFRKTEAYPVARLHSSAAAQQSTLISARSELWYAALPEKQPHAVKVWQQLPAARHPGQRHTRVTIAQEGSE